LFGQSWSLMSLATWLAPLSLLALGGALAYGARRWLCALERRETSDGVLLAASSSVKEEAAT
jgi:hypothetical protein